MERRQFLGATALAAAAIAATAATSVSTSSNGSNTSVPINCGPAPVPRPSAFPSVHPVHQRHSEVESAYRHVQRVIEMLSRDTNDYGGHKAPAVGFLQQAAGELEQALAFEQAHPSATPPPI